MIQEDWVEHDVARLHYLQWGDAADLTPLVYIPGSLGSANHFREEMQLLAPRRTVAVSPRGLGESSAPQHGYSFTNRVDDLEVVLDRLALAPSCVMAFSLGVPVALRYATRNPTRVPGMILLDYPARYPARSPEWLERALPFARERGIPERVVRRLQLESEQVELWDELPDVRAPVLIIKGGKSPAVSDDDLDRYRKELPHAQIEVFEDSGHEVHQPDYERFIGLVEKFLRSLD